MWAKVVLGPWLTALAGLLAGCAHSAAPPSPPPYRTVTTQPLRDTEAAKQANQRGLDCLARGDLDRAAAAFGEALTADVEFGPAHNNLGKVYFQKKDWYQAAWEFEYARKLLPRHAEPRNNLGLVLEQGGQLDRAVEQYREAVGLDPGNVEYLANLTRALIRRGDRTNEVRGLLQQMIDRDSRPQWRSWARQQLANLGAKTD